MMDTAVATEYLARLTDDGAIAMEIAGLFFNERCVVAVRDETDLLAVRLISRDETSRPCVLADFILCQAADGEAGSRELFLRE